MIIIRITFSVGYAALNYLYPNQNKYAYMLEGYDTDWNDAGSRKEAFYTNLKPGDYVFRVRASNNDGLWNDEGGRCRFIFGLHSGRPGMPICCIC